MVPHLAGILNVAADAKSRNRQVLFQVAPEAQTLPDKIPQNLLDLLVLNQPDWTSVNWRRLLGNYVKQVYQPAQARHTKQLKSL